MTEFFGKYRGVVTDIQDPLMTMRIKASVPDVYGDGTSGWAMPCSPFGGNQVGLFALPTVGAGVWIEFEHGDPDYPVWTGCWWGSAAEVPTQWLAPPYKKLMVVTPAGHSITVDDTPGVGGITLQTADGAKVVLSAIGLQITNGQGATIQLTGPQVSINNGALDVT
ncbi:phage baseplate assembly protein V [Nocardioides taihuensis]|uniref:Phage baseplate assembly protein V n=1 Tax=Nocardioides taihuensis TaxID=1835606 RepID=A0ABW0BDG2_9ACTN